MSNAPSSEVDKVAKEMIASIEKNGPEHFLRWIGQWYSQLTVAQVKEQYADPARQSSALERERIERAALADLLIKGRYINNKSSGAGENMLSEAYLSSLALYVQGTNVYRQHMRQLEVVREQCQHEAAEDDVGGDSETPRA